MLENNNLIISKKEIIYIYIYSMLKRVYIVSLDQIISIVQNSIKFFRSILFMFRTIDSRCLHFFSQFIGEKIICEVISSDTKQVLQTCSDNWVWRLLSYHAAPPSASCDCDRSTATYQSTPCPAT